MTTDTEKRLLHGRLTEATDSFVEAFTASVGFDTQLASYDIAGSIAHATMLEKIGILTSNELALIKSGLNEIQVESFKFKIHNSNGI
ncbi:MAG: hypothetical protein IIC33_04800 [Chloroflexi bacterium]|nr:hypothetical protein [Chloroflexota bacterium]